jgi:hypothetical protein
MADEEMPLLANVTGKGSFRHRTKILASIIVFVGVIRLFWCRTKYAIDRVSSFPTGLGCHDERDRFDVST